MRQAPAFDRLLSAIRYSFTGFRHAIANELAIRKELIALVILVPVSAVLPVSDIEHLILVVSMMLVVLVEFVNAAVESTVDRLSTERHSLSGQAKDMASAAVFIAVMMSGLCWVVIAAHFPAVLRLEAVWITGGWGGGLETVSLTCPLQRALPCAPRRRAMEFDEISRFCPRT